ncbi:hypothetical protein N288_23300 [Bacillus infantis NRRL B-14911]|uniref:O-antigen ligase-related domain-containing protein n=2 Tax=Bacillaceae TaxID=186817 RepID=U5LF56_9BACI|nr:hypothetical protein N288_23300 [Bacillus infantis NRRL B-14911]
MIFNHYKGNFLVKLWFIVAILFPFDASLLLPFSVLGTAISVNRILLILALVVTSFKIIQNQKIKVVNLGTEPVFMILIVFSFLSISWNNDKAGAIQAFTFLIISYILFYLGIYIKTKNLEYRLAYTILLISLMFASLDAILGFRLQISTQSEFKNEIISLFFNPAFFGATMVLLLPFIIQRTLTSKKIKLVFNVFINILVIYFVFRTGSKGIVVSLTLVYLIFIFHFTKKRTYFIKVIISCVIITVLTIFLLEKDYLPREIELKLYEISDIFSGEVWESADSSFGSRNMVWKVGIEKFQENPLLGHGFGSSYSVIYEEVLNSKVLAFHNWWIQILVETGILGSLLFVFLYSKSIVTNLIANHENRIIYLSILVSFIPISLTVGNVLQLWTWWMLFGITFVKFKGGS